MLAFCRELGAFPGSKRNASTIDIWRVTGNFHIRLPHIPHAIRKAEFAGSEHSHIFGGCEIVSRIADNGAIDDSRLPEIFPEIMVCITCYGAVLKITRKLFEQ